MRALIIFTALLLNQFAYAQTTQQATKPVAKAKTKATTAAPATPATAPAAPVAPATPEPAVAPTPVETPTAPVAEETGVTIPSQFRAGAFVNPGLTYFKRKVSDPGSATGNGDVNAAHLDVRGGYIFDFGLIVGGHLATSTGKMGTDDVTSTLGGLLLGYSCKTTGLFLTATYHLFGALDQDTLGKFDKASGLQVDLGYPMEINESMKIGPQISIKSIKYEDNPLQGDYKSKDVIPALGLWFYF